MTSSGLRQLAVLLLALAPAGCTFQSAQLDFLRDAFTDATEPDVLPGWRATLGQKTRDVSIVSRGNLFVFVSDDGDAASFDGWTVRAITGFGRRERLTIRDQDAARQYVQAGSYIEHRCAPWVRSERVEGIRWRQTCTGRARYDNVIDVDAVGNIERIRQVIDETGTWLTLERLGES
ncbi:MAG: hypothetical protein ACKOZX_02505 [Gammaproteobacteria bacterium]